jgi:MoaA/NifB/PqqE/SkfB family radical SAM enzyme
MGISLHQALKIGTYVLKKKITGQERYPLVLMLEPLFRCNLACVAVARIQYPPTF